MGTLTPNTSYIYERTGPAIYARRSGEAERKLVGYTTDSAMEQLSLVEWAQILQTAKSNTALQKAVDHVILLYRLSNQDGK